MPAPEHAAAVAEGGVAAASRLTSPAPCRGCDLQLGPETVPVSAAGGCGGRQTVLGTARQQTAGQVPGGGGQVLLYCPVMAIVVVITKSCSRKL